MVDADLCHIIHFLEDNVAPKSSCGNQYAVVFMDYLTKWSEVYPDWDQTAPTIVRLLSEKFYVAMGFKMKFFRTVEQISSLAFYMRCIHFLGPTKFTPLPTTRTRIT